MLVCFSHLQWDFVWQRPQHLLSRFAERMLVVVVEGPREADSAPGLDVKRRGNVTIVTPLLGPANALASGFGPAANATIRGELESFLGDEPACARCSSPVLWYYTPLALGAEPVNLLGKALVVYDAMDELASFRGRRPHAVNGRMPFWHGPTSSSPEGRACTPRDRTGSQMSTASPPGSRPSISPRRVRAWP